MACGLWVKQGSKHEQDSDNGLSHLLEHLMINIDNRNNPRFQKLINEVSSEGVAYNAGTTKETTSYYFTGLASNLNKCIETLSSIVMNNNSFSPDLFENEKKVVLQEATSYYSSFNQIKERTSQALWGDIGIGKIIVGGIGVIKNANIETMDQIVQSTYTPENSTLIIVGGIDYEKTMNYVNEYFADWEDRDTRGYKETVDSEPGIYFNCSEGSSNSVLSIGFRSAAYSDKGRANIEIISKVLGDSTLESRLVQEIRMKRGLAYNVGSFTSFYENRGTLGFTAVCANDSVNEVTQVMMEEFYKIKNSGLTSDEIRRAKKVLETKKLLELDNLVAQLKFLGKCSISGQLFSLEQEIRDLKRIKDENVQNTINDIFIEENMGFASIGDYDIDGIIPSLKIG